MQTELLDELKDLVFDSSDMLALIDGLVGLAGANKSLLAELKAAHQIIRNALSIMETSQKDDWAHLNANQGLIECGITRANEREAVIEKAEHHLKSTCAYRDGGTTHLAR